MPPIGLTRSLIDKRVAELGGPSVVAFLVACGDSLRRSSQPWSARPEETERALAALSVADVTSALGAIDLGVVEAHVKRAAEEAFEAAFADSPEERALFSSSAVQALEQRDRVASMVAAASAVMQRAQQGAPRGALEQVVSSTTAALAASDAKLASLTRSLTGANSDRRRERDKLDPSCRADAWWYSSRSDEGDDGLLMALGGNAVEPSSLSQEAARDIERSSLFGSPMRTESALRRVAVGGAVDAAERAYLERRASGDPDLARALELVRDTSIEASADEDSKS